jgi:hypothetical protein
MKKLEQELSRISDDVKRELIHKKEIEYRPKAIPTINLENGEYPLNLLLNEHHREDLKERFVSDDGVCSIKKM